MNGRLIILERLAEAERNLADGNRAINEQYRLIAVLERDGHDTTDAVNLVIQLLENQELREHEWDGLRAKLEDFRD